MGPPIDEAKCDKEQDNETKHNTIHLYIKRNYSTQEKKDLITSAQITDSN